MMILLREGPGRHKEYFPTSLYFYLNHIRDRTEILLALQFHNLDK